MVYIIAQDGGNAHGKQWEHGKDRLGRLTHVAHVAVGDKGYDGQAEHTVLETLVLEEVEHERCNSHHKHDDILDDGNRRGCPEGVGGNLSK